MNAFLDFLIANWQLSGLLVVMVTVYLVFEFIQQVMPGNSVSPEEAVVLINHQKAVVLDVRTPQEFSTGHILDAINVDASESDVKLKTLNKYMQRPVIVVCAHGKRSTLFAKRLRTLGFSTVVNLTGGLHAWQNSGLPLTTSGADF